MIGKPRGTDHVKSQLTVVGLGGSLAKHSSSLAALKIALQGADETGAKTALLDIRQLSLPMYDPADENPPDSVREMCDAIHQADGLIWSSPMSKRAADCAVVSSP